MRLGHHESELAANMVIMADKFFVQVLGNVSEMQSKIQPYDSFSSLGIGVSEFADEAFRVASFAPSLGNVGAH